MDISKDMIDDFVRGLLPEAKANEIKKMAETNPELSEAINEAKIDLALANQLLTAEIKNLTDSWQNEKSVENKKINLRKTKTNNLLKVFTIVAIGISAISLVSLAIYKFITSKDTLDMIKEENQQINKEEEIDYGPDVNITNADQNTNEELNSQGQQISLKKNKKILFAAKLYPTIDNTIILRRGISPQQTDLNQDLLNYYQIKDITSLQKSLDTFGLKSSIGILASELLSRIYFESGKFEKSINLLTALVSLNHTEQEKYEFMLLLNYYCILPKEIKKYQELKATIQADSNHEYFNETSLLKDNIE